MPDSYSTLPRQQRTSTNLRTEALTNIYSVNCLFWGIFLYPGNGKEQCSYIHRLILRTFYNTNIQD